MHRVSIKESIGDSSTDASLEAGLTLLEEGNRIAGTCRHRRRSTSNTDGLCEGLQGPCRLIRLCILGIVVPACLIAIPLYVRYHILHEQQYPVAFSDVRLIDGRVSTTWCQRQTVQGNASFNAYLMPETPNYNSRPAKVSMIRHMVLEDDMKEYWGFYLLPGSEVHIKVCSRWPGASLIAIKGHKHLRDCAYIGDNSSEEEDELLDTDRNVSPRDSTTEKLARKAATDQTTTSKTEPTVNNGTAPPRGAPNPLVNEGRINDDPITSEEALDELLSKVSSLGPSGQRALKKLAHQLHSKEKKDVKGDSEKDQLMAQLLQELLKASGSKLQLMTLQEEIKSIDARARRSAKRDNVELQELLEEVVKERKINFVLNRSKRLADLADELHGRMDPSEDAAFEEGLEPDGIADTRGKILENTTNDRSNDEFWSSFSSSEETLMQCEGLLVYMPLDSSSECSAPGSAATMSHTNTYSYTAPTSGYYFFVFNSENEIQENLISVEFSLARTTYNTSMRVAQCDNTTTCAFPLDFFSSEKVVLEVPVAPGKEGPSNSSADSLAKHWNEEYLIVSTCEPRTSLYLVFMLLVPILILTFAFQ
ncbi:uncharacterized protein LOC132196789 isoform X2 [Neocloeon triangulifer]|uniref:uncharacterized protein LOC132196789 isoform X2 n=1 Tax=Neocloeon triangulifer TaxID=2078957 RepID=UPI00286F37C0|nr:uncharacterized protein LOC132196789 isoform X2 [Neocloeon triangulifer]